VLEVNEYLPFGGRLASSIVSPPELNRYRFGGKEEQRFGSVDIHLSDFGARYYDSFTCRWNAVDPLAGKYPGLSPYNYCAGNPVNLTDPTGRSIGDFFNLWGKLIGSDGKDDGKKYLVLDNKEAKAVKTNTKNGTPTSKSNVPSAIEVPSNEVVDSMEAAYSLTESNGKEHGFRVGNKGSVTSMVEGTETEISNWEDAKSELREKGEYADYDVHTHPEGTPDKYGKAEPSDTDKNNVIKSGNHPSVVLGYEPSTVPPGPNTIGGEPSVKFVRHIGYFNENGLIAPPVKFDTFKRTVNKINGTR